MNEVEVQILKIDEDRVQIGITAPADIPVHRYEVFKKNARKAATKTK